MAPDKPIEARWAELGSMDRSALRVAWTGAYGKAPPHFLSTIFMRKALIWQAQCKRFGGVSPGIQRVLKAASGGKAVRPPTAKIKLGTQLVREWNGRHYRVEVAEGGYRMNGECFRSLSAIALQITGTTWSGPRFFGLTKAAGRIP
jgi:Protein of unknown function (DUF2924)